MVLLKQIINESEANGIWILQGGIFEDNKAQVLGILKNLDLEIRFP